MPHFGLMNEVELGVVNGPLQRARLHVRGGKRRLREGKIAAGIVTLYDALLAAMDFYVASGLQKGTLKIERSDNLNDEKSIYALLVRSGALDGAFDFAAFDRLVETALHNDLPGYDYRDLLAGIESVMARLGVMPFDESALPAEDPATF